MSDFLKAICPVMMWVFALCHLFFIVLFTLKFRKTKNISYLFCALVSFGLFYDSLILACGVFATDNGFFRALSQFRFISHGTLIPLLFAITAYNLKVHKIVKYVLLGVTAVLAILGFAEGCATVLELKSVANIIRYASSKELTPSWARAISSLLSYGAVAPLLIGGIYDLIKTKRPYFFLSGFLMFVFSALGPATGNSDLIFFISMFGEFFMMLFLLLSVNHHQKLQVK